MVCESCKASIPDSAKFCPQCGSRVEKAEPPKNQEISPPVQAAAAPAAAGPAEAGTIKPEAPPAPVKPKSGNAVFWILIVVILLAAGAAGGYFFYKIFIQKDMSGPGSQTVRSAPDQARYPGASGDQNPQGVQPLQPGQQQPAPMPPTTVEVTESAIVMDIVNGLPTGFTTEFRAGASRAVHYVKYNKAQPGQTNISSQFYKDGKLVFKCGPNVVQYRAGNYFCRPDKDFEAGIYEVKFFVDGMERPPLSFRVMQ